MRVRALFVVLSVLGSAAIFAPSAAGEAMGKNAALRYWMAFATMKNLDSGSDVAKRLRQMVEGAEPWDESLSAVLQQNQFALDLMDRGSQLPECDWGFEHEQGHSAPIAHLPRAWALAALNVLRGRRLAQQGQGAEAMAAWRSGLRFSQHISADSPLICALVAGGCVKIHLRAMTDAVRTGTVDPGARRTMEPVIADLPEAGFDWSVAARYEVAGIIELYTAMEREEDPLRPHQKPFPDYKRPSDEEVARELGLEVSQLADRAAVRASLRRSRVLLEEAQKRLVAACRMPHAQSVEAMRSIEADVARGPVLELLWLGPTKLAAMRGEVVKARAELLAALRRPAGLVRERDVSRQ